MNCPRETADILSDILTHGLLQARMAGWSGDAARAALEADHVHNLPRLLTEFDPINLQYYWEAERPCYLDKCDPQWATVFEPLWERLRPHISSVLLPISP